jgi:universal stress protein A
MSVYSHILVAVDFSAAADHVLAKAREIAQRNNARISLLHVVEYLPPIDYLNDSLMDINWVAEEKVMLDHARDRMQQYGKKHKLVDVDLEVELGTPKNEISRYVKEHKCDLVVLGSHGRHGISLLLGSTANAVLHDMPCDVLTVKIEKEK